MKKKTAWQRTAFNLGSEKKKGNKHAAGGISEGHLGLEYDVPQHPLAEMLLSVEKTAINF